MRKTKIVGTLGPSSADARLLLVWAARKVLAVLGVLCALVVKAVHRGKE
ncbi:MAG: hypothetical protein ACYSU0_14105 [Planctomycetota bacterium]|jgi:pyruvate kinase